MAHRLLLSAVCAATVLACAPPTGLTTDGLDAPPSSLGPTSSGFPNAPRSTDWTTVGSIEWQAPVPLRRDPVFEPDNGSHLVDWGDDDPARQWERQTAVVVDPEVPGTSKSVLELRLPRGLQGGYAATKIGQHPEHRGNGPLLWDPALSTGHLYLGVWVRFSPGFTTNRNVAQKVLYVKSDLPANAALAHAPIIMFNDDAGGDQLWPTYIPQHPFGRYEAPRTAANDLNDGRWHLVEMLQGPNTPGVANGTLRIWVDGRLEGDWATAKFFDVGQVPSLNRLEINPIFGGGPNPVPQDQWIRLGPMLVRTR